MKASDFRSAITKKTSNIRNSLDAQASGWDVSQRAIDERVKKVSDAVTGFDFFINTYFPHFIRNPHRSKLHEYLFTELPKVTVSKDSVYMAIAAPRGEAKSTIVSQLYSLYRIITGQSHYILIVMDSIDQAYPMLEAIKTELDSNPRLYSDFPKVVGQGKLWQSGTIVTVNDVKVKVAGAGKKLRGLRHGAYRPDLIVLDDIENDENVRKPEQRDKLHNWLKKTILKLGGAGEKSDVIYIGTILHYDSVLNRTLDTVGWKTRRFKAIIQMPKDMVLWDEWEAIYLSDKDDDGNSPHADLFYKKNKKAMDAGAVVSWLARPIVELMKIRARDGHEAFDSEYQNDPTAGEDAPFSNAIQYWHELPPYAIYLGSCDPSLGKKGAGRDPSALLVGALCRQTGKLYVTTAAIKKRLPDRIIEDVITLQRENKCLGWAVETVQFQEFLKDELVKRSAKVGVPVPAKGIKPNTDKQLRIESLQPHIKNGLILLHQDQSTLIDQLKHFPKADHDDGPDALQMLWALAQGYQNKTSGQALDVPMPSIYGMG